VLAVTADREIPFKSTPARELLANAFHPDADATTLAGAEAARRRRTALVHVHGGVWNRGERSFFDDRCRALAARGFTALTVDYRLSGEATYPAALQDVQSAVRWLRADPPSRQAIDRIVLVGHSAGAHLTALVAATSDDPDHAPSPADDYGDAPTAVDGIVCFDGPYDLLGAEPGGETAEFIGADPTEAPERYRAASPREQATSAHPSALLYHADDDEWLTRRETRAYRDVLAHDGVDVDLHAPPGDHFFFTEPPWFERTVDHTVDFVDSL